MPIKVVELHHHGIRIGTTADEVEQARSFYSDVLGLSNRPRPDPLFPPSPVSGCMWAREERTTQIHLMGRERKIAHGQKAKKKTQPCRTSLWPSKTFKRPARS